MLESDQTRSLPELQSHHTVSDLPVMSQGEGLLVGWTCSQTTAGATNSCLWCSYPWSRSHFGGDADPCWGCLHTAMFVLLWMDSCRGMLGDGFTDECGVGLVLLGRLVLMCYGWGPVADFESFCQDQVGGGGLVSRRAWG